MASPELDFTRGEVFDEASGVVEFELGVPAHFAEEVGFFSWDGFAGSWRINIVFGFHSISPIHGE